MSSPATARKEESIRPPAEDESLVQHVTRSTRNCFHSVFGCLQTSDEKAKIRYKEYLIEARKKKFGVDYINLKKASTEEKGNEETLEQCLQQCLNDIEAMEQEIAVLRQEVDRVENETRSKIQTKSGQTSSTTKPTTTSGSKPETHTATTAISGTGSAAPVPSATPAVEPVAASTTNPAEPSKTSQEEDMEEIDLQAEKNN